MKYKVTTQNQAGGRFLIIEGMSVWASYLMQGKETESQCVARLICENNQAIQKLLKQSERLGEIRAEL